MDNTLKALIEKLKSIDMDSIEKLYNSTNEEFLVDIINQFTNSEDFLDKLSKIDKEILILWLNRYNLPHA